MVAKSSFSKNVASFYDRHFSASTTLGPYFRKCVDFQILPSLRGRDIRVLELGCGNGNLATYLARERSFHVTGVDLSPKSIALARENAKLQGVDVTFIASDILDEHLDLPRFDVIVGHFVLHEFLGGDFDRLAAFLAAHVEETGYCSFLENNSFNPVFRWIRAALPRSARVSHENEYPFDPARYAVLGLHFKSVRRDCPAVNLADRFYRQFWPRAARLEAIHSAALTFDHAMTLALPASIRPWVSYFQIVSFAQQAVGQRLNPRAVRSPWWRYRAAANL